MMCLEVDSLGLSYLGFTELFESVSLSFAKLGKFSHYFFTHSFHPGALLLWDSSDMNVRLSVIGP